MWQRRERARRTGGRARDFGRDAVDRADDTPPLVVFVNELLLAVTLQ